MSHTVYQLKTSILSLKKILKSLQLETYLLIILPATWVLMSIFFEKSILTLVEESKKALIIESFFYGGDLIRLGSFLLYLYIYFRIFIWFGHWIGRKIFNDETSSIIDLKQFLLSFVYIMIALGLYNLVLVVSLAQLSAVSSQASIISSSQLFMSMDKRIFGVYPQLWIQQLSVFHILDYLLIESYCKLSLFFTIVLMGLLFFNKKCFRKFLIAIFIAPFIAMPFWYILPAVTPDEMYRQNMFSLPSILMTQQKYEKVITSEHLKSFLKRLEKQIGKSKNNHPIVSTNPSMHVAWGAIITYFAMILWWPLGLIFIPWLILNILSTLYTMQHYAVDLPGGFICAVMAIIITNILFKFEKKYYTGTYASLYFIKIIQEDIQFIKTRLTAGRSRDRA